MIPFAALLALTLTAAPARDLSEGKAFYEAGEFAKAAARFDAPCRRGQSAEACYWAGLSYERLADTRTPFGCPTYRKAHAYLADAYRLAPAQYRDPLFEFLIGTSDCSRSWLKEAGSIVDGTSQFDPEYGTMRNRLAGATRWSRAPEERLATFFLCLPRTAVRGAGLPGALTAGRRAEMSARRTKKSQATTGESSRLRRATP